jgi:hypothetical protein
VIGLTAVVVIAVPEAYKLSCTVTERRGKHSACRNGESERNTYKHEKHAKDGNDLLHSPRAGSDAEGPNPPNEETLYDEAN